MKCQAYVKIHAATNKYMRGTRKCPEYEDQAQWWEDSVKALFSFRAYRPQTKNLRLIRSTLAHLTSPQYVDQAGHS